VFKRKKPRFEQVNRLLSIFALFFCWSEPVGLIIAFSPGRLAKKYNDFRVIAKKITLISVFAPAGQAFGPGPGFSFLASGAGLSAAPGLRGGA